MSNNIAGPDVYANDLSVGDTWDLGTYLISQDEVIDFASHWDPQYFHIDPERAATESPFGGVIASGVQTLAIFIRLWVTSRIGRWHVIAGAGIDQLRFLRPTRPGDLLTGRSVVETIRFQPEKERALITYRGMLSNQNDEPVITLTMSVFLRSHPAPAAGPHETIIGSLPS